MDGQATTAMFSHSLLDSFGAVARCNVQLLCQGTQSADLASASISPYFWLLDDASRAGKPSVDTLLSFPLVFLSVPAKQ